VSGGRGIGIYAPAGFVLDPRAIERAVAWFEGAGHTVVVDPSCQARRQRFAGDDSDRLAAVLRMATDPRVDLAIAARGGYGWSRLLDRIDYAAIAGGGKCWLGHSDFTAFQLAALALGGVTTYAGPMAAPDFGVEDVSAFTVAHCWPLQHAATHEVELVFDGPDGAFDGTLWGGNLALITHLVGSRYFPQVDNGILFVEDIGEAPYRVERMLQQLHGAGVLARQQALLFGVFNGYQLAPNDNGYDLEDVVAYARTRFGMPVYTGLPFGHVRDKLTLPVGGRVELAVRRGRARLFLHAGTR
jgi:muramoyltetrapeptide carboxypeptidase